VFFEEFQYRTSFVYDKPSTKMEHYIFRWGNKFRQRQLYQNGSPQLILILGYPLIIQEAIGG